MSCPSSLHYALTNECHCSNNEDKCCFCDKKPRIRTEFVYPPIPSRSFDWSAVDDNTYEPGQPIGWGATQQDAIADLMEQISLDTETLGF